MTKYLPFLLALFLLFTAQQTQAADLLWSQVYDGYAILGPSQQTRTTAMLNSEVADDFDVDGWIERLVVPGDRGFQAPPNPVVFGANVRFYASVNGQPGALQAEYFIAAGSGALLYDPVSVGQLDITLPAAFRATGKHFVAVQLVSDAVNPWYRLSANRYTPNLGFVQQRDNLAAGQWSSPYNVDAAFTLYGTLLAAPRLDSLSATTLPRSGRLLISGANFGNTRGDGRVLIDGIPAIISRWTASLISVYVPESARLGNVSVQVTKGAGASNFGALNVTARQMIGHVKWQLELDGAAMYFRPAVAPDGTVYVQDQAGRLYALNPDGGLKWIVSYGWPSGPVAVGADGIIYIATGWYICALYPNGTIKWEYTHPNSQGLIFGPAVGPDGKIYAVMDSPNSGAIALSATDGRLVWSNQGNPRINEYGQLGGELVFGASRAGGAIDQFYFAVDNATTAPQGHLYAFSLGGAQRWAVPNGGITPGGTAPDGTIYAGVAAYNPSNGSVRWSAYTALGGGANGLPAAGSDGRVYLNVLYRSQLVSLNGQTGKVLWQLINTQGMISPTVSPNNDVLSVSGQANFGRPGWFKLFTTGGQFLWQMDLSGEPYPAAYETASTPARFSNDGATIYVGTDILNEPQSQERAYLYALQVADAPVPPPPPAVTLTTLTVAPSSVTSGSPSQGTVTLSGAAPAGGAVVTLLSDNPAVANPPATVMIAAGLSTANFTINTGAVSASTAATISAGYGATRTAALTVTPVPPPPATVTLSALVINPSTVIGGNASQATVTLSGAAPAGGALVTLSSSDVAKASVPASVTVPAGASSASFPINTTVVSAAINISVTATLGVSRSATLTLNVPPLPDTLTITAADYTRSKGQLDVQVTGSNLSATLRVYVTATNALIGTLTNGGGGRYKGRFLVANPQNITVRSSAGGVAIKAVTVR